MGLLIAQARAEPGKGLGPDADPDAIVFFEQQVRPLLEKRCLKCHGGEKIEGKLSFATRDLMLMGGTSGKAIDLDQPQKSLLITAINYSDIDYEMPPAGKLPAGEIETLTQWVKMGLPWTQGQKGHLAAPKGAGQHHDGPLTIEQGKQYWAYKPLVKPEVPKVGDAQWGAHPIDAFIYDKLAREGLKPSPEADRVTLIRRATYNLTGLPPTPQEIEAFVADDGPEAWERVIDRLLASPHYGEQWARHWMDIARYAETNGYERDDVKRNIWRYRDYLIRSFNSDKPYDRFVKEHVAGDLLPDRDAQSLIATGFNRLQIWDDEPTDPEQARADYIADIVSTTGEALLATTVGCARCHDHKKDPVLQSDYYALFAFYNNIAEPVRGKDDAISVSIRDIPTGQDEQAQLKAWEDRVAALSERVELAEQAFAKALGSEFKKSALEPVAEDSSKSLQAWRYATQDPGEEWHLQPFDDSAWPQAQGGFGHSVDKPYFPNDWVTDNIYLRRNFRLTEIPRFLVMTVTHQGPTDVYINGIRIYHSDKGTGPSHRQLQLPAEALSALVVGSNSFAVKSNQGPGPEQYIDTGLYSGIFDPRVALHSAIDAMGKAVLGEEADKAYQENRGELMRLNDAPVARPYPALVINEHGKEAPAQFIHLRGSAHAAGDQVPPRFPLVLGGEVPAIPDLPDDVNATGRRLALAQWLASADNPLAARVMVNRIWQHQFGRGIVRSASDFGQLGEQPTHPELLNYLAATFIEQGWSIKQVQKFIMTSRAYRMSSASQDLAMEKDPVNNLFWRYDMRRLTAEEFRDSLLAVNGSLNEKMFGPSVYTKMPAAVLATASRPDQAWGSSSESERDRRSIYIHVKRSLREPLLSSLDQAETDTPCPVRFATTVPTQSLITLNSEQMQEEAAVFARRLIKEAGPKTEDRVRLGLKLVLGREPSEQQISENVAFTRSMREKHGLTQERALELFCLVAYNLNGFAYLD